jgi:hypothetical protein
MRMPIRRFSLLAVEVGGHSRSSLERARDGAHDTIIVAQNPSESAAQFAARLVERIESVRSEGSSIVRASLACSERHDVEAIAARLLVVRTMLVNSPDLCDADVSLTSPCFALRHQLEAIRETLREHGLRRAPLDGEPEVAAPNSAPLQRVA